jgi:hypothetical protein
VYAEMRNVSIDAHYYNWIAHTALIFGANQNALASEVSDAQNLGHSADGVMPVLSVSGEIQPTDRTLMRDGLLS